MNNLRIGFFLMICFFAITGVSQSVPPGIPYQAVVRNTDGTVAANANLTTRFTLHQSTTEGAVEFQETHTLVSNAQGLVSAVIGQGTAVQSNFSSIVWSNTNKFLQVEINLGNGYVHLGTQQLMSVPYALYSGNTNVSISTTGDTLTIGGQSVIVPGISAANPNNNPISGLGSQVLPGNTTCANEYISVTGCNGQTSLTYDGRTYDLVEIGGQCWFADNLATDQYRNGDLIPTGLSNSQWQNSTSGAYAIYNNDSANDAIYGKLYNWYTTVDSRGLCPLGWHVPSDCEWMFLEGAIGMPVDQQVLANQTRGSNEGGLLKSTSLWSAPNSLATNTYGFNAIPGGYKLLNGTYTLQGNYGFWWCNNEFDSSNAWGREPSYFNGYLDRQEYNKKSGFSVRCIRD